MKWLSYLVAASILIIASSEVRAQTQPSFEAKHQRCDAFAKNAMASAPTSTGVVRGAARGAVGGAIFGNAGAGAAAGAVVGAARKSNQKSSAYQTYYINCMASP